MYDDPKTDKALSAVSLSVERLAGKAEECDACVQITLGRLDDVLTPLTVCADPPPATPANTEVPLPVAPLVDALDDITQRVQRATDTLTSIIERLAI
jgi:hypothetical protein